jgi:hypothetical protein
MKEPFIERFRNWCMDDLNAAIKKIGKPKEKNKDGWELDTNFFKTPGE